MDLIGEIFQYKFLTNAFIASLLSGLICGVAGVYIVARRIVFLSGGITHASFGGIGIAYYFGLNPVAGAAVFAILSALGIEWASGRGRLREDSTIGIMWSVGMATGIIFIYMTPGYAPNLMSFLFGNILTVTDTDIFLLSVTGAAILLLAAFMWRPLMYVAFDREYSATQGIPVRAVSYLMSVIIALTIVFSIRAVGIMLLISLLTIPPVIVNTFTKSFASITVWSAAVAILGNLAGLFFSYNMNIPAGAAAIFVLAGTLLAVRAVKYAACSLRTSASA